MADIFIRYARADRKRVRPFAEALEKKGWQVWWDLQIRSGSAFDRKTPIGTVCRPKPSGSTPAEPGAPRNFSSVTTCTPLRIMPGIPLIQAVVLIPWRRRRPMSGVFTICMATSGNGWRTIGTVLTKKMPPLTGAPGLMTPGAPTGCFAAAAGTSVHITAGRRRARQPRLRCRLSPCQVRYPWPLSPCTLGRFLRPTARGGERSAAEASAGGG